MRIFIIIAVMICLMRVRPPRPIADAGSRAICSGEPENDVSRATNGRGKNRILKKKNYYRSSSSSPRRRDFALRKSRKSRPLIELSFRVFFSRPFFLRLPVLRLFRFAPFNSTTMRIDALLSHILRGSRNRIDGNRKRV